MGVDTETAPAFPGFGTDLADATAGGKETIRQVGDREREYELLIKPLEQIMMRMVWRILRDAEDANDALQDTLAKIWDRWDRIRVHPNPRALVLRICANAAYDVLRLKLRRRTYEKSTPELPESTDPSDSARQLLARREMRAEIFDKIAQLPRGQAQAILMRCVNDLSYEEIAAAMKCSETTVRKQVARGRAKLCKLLAHLSTSHAMEVAR